MRAKLVGESVTINMSLFPGTFSGDAEDDRAFILPRGVSTSCTASVAMVPVI